VAAEKTGAAPDSLQTPRGAGRAVILEIGCSATGRKDATLSDAVTSGAPMESVASNAPIPWPALQASSSAKSIRDRLGNSSSRTK